MYTKTDIYNRLKDKLITINDIRERIVLIDGSDTDYISENGNVYKKYDDINWYKKTNTINKHNGYSYCAIYYKDKIKQRRVHILVAKAFILNDDEQHKTIVGHMDNQKSNNVYTNLYWTTSSENTKKAVDDGLNNQPMGIHNKNSRQIKVVDLNNNLVSVYGSMRDCERLIKNLDMGYLLKMLPNNLDYTPRNKKYKYCEITKWEFLNTEDKLKNIELEECEKLKKQTRIFRAVNLDSGKEYISDNQKRFALEHSIPQASISNCLINNRNYNNEWKFETIKEISYKDGSGYANMIDLTDNTVIRNIHTNEALTFNTQRELKEYFGFTGHSVRESTLINGCWEVV